MRTFYSHKASCPSLCNTSTTFYPPHNPTPYNLPSQHQYTSYLSTTNHRLLNEITDSQTQKNYYRSKLTQQFHTHHEQLQQAYGTISEKNGYIITLEEQLDRMSKDYRVLSDEYVGLKGERDREREVMEAEVELVRRKCEERVRQVEDEAVMRVEVMVQKRVQEVEGQCEKRVDMFKAQLEQAKHNATQLQHQLKLLQEDYLQITTKNATIIQQSINRQLRQHDFHSQHSHLQSSTQVQHLKNANLQLKTSITQQIKQLQSATHQLTRLKAENLVLRTRLTDLQAAFQHQKHTNRVTLEQKHKSTQDFETNTEQQFVPVIMPVETNLCGELAALKEFLAERMIEKYEEFFSKASLKEKKKSASLITFKNYLSEEVKKGEENALLMHVHTGLQRLVKLYCPALTYSREFLTVKDEFVRKTLMECEAVTNKEQKLFRLLELVHRLRNPITHVKSEVSIGEVKMVEVKVMATLKRVFKEGK